MIDGFLARAFADGRCDQPLTSRFAKVLIHGHCHQKALFGTAAMKQVFDRVPGLPTRKSIPAVAEWPVRSATITTSCHRRSARIDCFPPSVLVSADTEVVACGISCRHQLRDFLDVHARHWVEVFEVNAER